MVGNHFFRWEDSPALNHHCGFCEKTLNHPGARSSCYGTHVEPCHRYHQAMFMRFRSHTCYYCRTIDEAHHRRHKKIAESIRDVYESCGCVEWTIIPAEPEERGGSRSHVPGLTGRNDTDRSDVVTEETTISKREKKDAKTLARAASRPKLISHDDVLHVDSVIHSAEGLAVGNDSPSNADEMEEIERHLTYNAHVYYSKLERREYKKYIRLPGVDVDFGTEIDRIFQTFRITELLTTNTRNRGLQGKKLKNFRFLVDELKKAVVEDLVLVKRDALEIKMRRAGYLRYINRTAYSIVEDRYMNNDWKTGGKYLETKSSSSSMTSLDEVLGSAHSIQSADSPARPHTILREPDRRHLESVHKCVNFKDGLAQYVIEPGNAPSPSTAPASAIRNLAGQLRVVAPEVVTSLSMGENTSKNDSGSSATVLGRRKSKAPSVKRSRGMTAESRSIPTGSRPVNPWGVDAPKSPNLCSSKSLAIQPPEVSEIVEMTASKGPERFVNGSEAVVEDAPLYHPAVSQKKAKKYERKAKRKTKKPVVQDDATATDLDTHVNLSAPCNENSSDIEPSQDSLAEDAVDAATIPLPDEPNAEPRIATPETSPSLPPTKLASKHDDWTRFEHQFILDKLTKPFQLNTWELRYVNPLMYQYGAKTKNGGNCPNNIPKCMCGTDYASLYFFPLQSISLWKEATCLPVARSAPKSRIVVVDTDSEE